MTLRALDASDLRDRIQSIVDEVLSTESTLLTRISPDLEPLNGTLRQFLSGGKRLRAAFAYWGWRGAGGDASDRDSDDAAMRAAASLEFLQACALMHDDVMDGSETRRGVPAVHHQFANLHRGNVWLGSPEAFGIGAAILLGDLCLSWADQTLMTASFPATTLARAKAIYDEMRTELMAGQYLDLAEQARGGGSIERARTVVRYKSAKYTIERPLHIGAALADADDAVYAAYSAYGLPLGEAFQLRDDVLGVFGDPTETGKPAGDDLREGKRTILVARAFEQADAAQQGKIRQHLGDPMLDANGIDTLRTIITETGALAETERMIEELLEQSLDAVRDPAIDEQAQEILVQLAYAATRRKG